jgi:hypothetical protein
MDIRSAGIATSSLKKPKRSTIVPDQRYPAPPALLLSKWPPSLGIGGRLPSEWVAAFRRNEWPLSVGLRILGWGIDLCNFLVDGFRRNYRHHTVSRP